MKSCFITSPDQLFNVNFHISPKTLGAYSIPSVKNLSGLCCQSMILFCTDQVPEKK